MSMLKRNNYKVDDLTLSNAVKECTSIRQLLQKLSLNDTGTAYRNIKRRIKNLNIDISHFTGQAYLKNKNHNWSPKQDMKNILVKEICYENIASLKNDLFQKII
jgi:hypothetical protein